MSLISQLSRSSKRVNQISSLKKLIQSNNGSTHGSIGISVSLLLRRGICHKDHLDPEVVSCQPPPWPYETKKWNHFHKSIGTDRTMSRWDENTVIISVEGNIASGKAEFASKLAEELGMKFMPEPRIETTYVNEHGYDYRKLNKYLPDEAHWMDWNMMWENPKHVNIAATQINMYKYRYWEYINALTHLYSTGQGVITERCPWSDAVFARAEARLGCWHPEVANYYTYLQDNTLHELQRPHLVIYLDSPIEILRKRLEVKAKNGDETVRRMLKSPLLKDNGFLRHIEECYKEKILPSLEESSLQLLYNMSDPPSIENVVEDIEKLDFYQYRDHGMITDDWRFDTEDELNEFRQKYANDNLDLLINFILPTYDTETLDMSPDTVSIRDNIMTNIVPNEYAKKFDPKKVGWLKTLFGGEYFYRDEQRRMWLEWTDVKPNPNLV